MTSNLFGITPTRSTIKSLVNTQESLVTGIRYPIGKKGVLFSKSSKEELLRGQLLQLLFTVPGERVMLPTFGLQLKQYLFSPLGATDISSIKKAIYKQVGFYINTAELVSLVVNEIEETATTLQGLSIQMRIRDKDTNEVMPLEFIL